jgi:CCR4-NOT transcription complex subunit 2
LSGLAAGSAFGTGPSRAGGFYSEDLDSGGNIQLDGSGLLGGLTSGLQTGSSNPGHQSSAAGSGASASGGSGSAAGSALSGDYGLLGLLSVIRMTDADRNALALGTDLTMLGLNLNSNDNLYSNFSSPWTEAPASAEPHYQVSDQGVSRVTPMKSYLCTYGLQMQLPMCYYMQPPALKTGHLSKFELATLFYIFYSLPKDVLQAYAAQELYNRDWRYHAELKRWFKRATPQDGVATTNGSAPQYLYFDINSWERRLFTGNMNQNVTSGFMTEEDVRVKFPTS